MSGVFPCCVTQAVEVGVFDISVAPGGVLFVGILYVLG